MFMDENGSPLEKGDKVNLTLLINKKMMHSSIESRRRKYVKRYGFLSYMRNL